MDSVLRIYCFILWSNFNFLHSSQWINFPTQSYSFCYNLYVINSFVFFTTQPILAILLRLINFPVNIVGPYDAKSFRFLAISSHSLSISSLRYNALCNRFQVLWSTCTSASFVHFKNRSEYLKRWIAYVFIPLMRILP